MIDRLIRLPSGAVIDGWRVLKNSATAGLPSSTTCRRTGRIARLRWRGTATRAGTTSKPMPA